MLLYLLVIPVLWAAAIPVVEQNGLFDGAVQQGSNLTRLFKQDTVAMLQGVDCTLLMLRHECEKDPDKFDPSGLLQAAGLIIQYSIIGQSGEGTTLLSSDGTVGTANFGDRD